MNTDIADKRGFRSVGIWNKAGFPTFGRVSGGRPALITIPSYLRSSSPSVLICVLP